MGLCIPYIDGTGVTRRVRHHWRLRSLAPVQEGDPWFLRRAAWHGCWTVVSVSGLHRLLFYQTLIVCGIGIVGLCKFYICWHLHLIRDHGTSYCHYLLYVLIEWLWTCSWIWCSYQVITAHSQARGHTKQSRGERQHVVVKARYTMYIVHRHVSDTPSKAPASWCRHNSHSLGTRVYTLLIMLKQSMVGCKLNVRSKALNQAPKMCEKCKFLTHPRPLEHVHALRTSSSRPYI